MYTVNYTKHFTTGTLHGMAIPCKVEYASRSSAEQFVTWVRDNGIVHSDCITNNEWTATSIVLSGVPVREHKFAYQTASNEVNRSIAWESILSHFVRRYGRAAAWKHIHQIVNAIQEN